MNCPDWTARGALQPQKETAEELDRKGFHAAAAAKRNREAMDYYMGDTRWIDPVRRP